MSETLTLDENDAEKAVAALRAAADHHAKHGRHLIEEDAREKALALELTLTAFGRVVLTVEGERKEELHDHLSRGYLEGHDVMNVIQQFD